MNRHREKYCKLTYPKPDIQSSGLAIHNMQHTPDSNMLGSSSAEELRQFLKSKKEINVQPLPLHSCTVAHSD